MLDALFNVKRVSEAMGRKPFGVPEGRLRIAQDFSPGPAPGQNLLESRRDELRIAQDFSPGPAMRQNLLESRRDGRE